MDGRQCGVSCSRVCLQVSSRRSWERLLLDPSCGISGDGGLGLFHTWDLLTRLADKRRSLCSVFTAGSFECLESLASVLGGKVLDLRSLGADNV